MAEGGELDPFVLVVEGSIPNEDIKRLRLLWLPAHVRHTVAFTPCREIQRAA